MKISCNLQSPELSQRKELRKNINLRSEKYETSDDFQHKKSACHHAQFILRRKVRQSSERLLFITSIFTCKGHQCRVTDIIPTNTTGWKIFLLNTDVQIEWTSVTSTFMVFAYVQCLFPQTHPEFCCNLEYFVSLSTNQSIDWLMDYLNEQ